MKGKLDECHQDFGGDGGAKWLGYSSDMWTSRNMDGALGLSFRFIDRDMVVITIAAALLKLNDSHTAANVASKLLKVCNDRYGIDLQAVASSGASDTANAARAVQSVLGIDQSDCTMHVISLLLSYTLGMRENYKTDKSIDKEGKEVKVRYIVTPGGPFAFGSEIIKVLKDIANYFGSSPQRKDEYETIKKRALLPIQHIKSPGETRVSSHITLLQTAMMNHYAFTLYDMQTKDKAFNTLWEKCKAQSNWKVCFSVCVLIPDILFF